MTVTATGGSGGKANGTATLTVPTTAATGTDVTLTIEAENAAAGDMNYVVLRFSVAAKVREKDGLSYIGQIKRTLYMWRIYLF